MHRWIGRKSLNSDSPGVDVEMTIPPNAAVGADPAGLEDGPGREGDIG